MIYYQKEEFICIKVDREEKLEDFLLGDNISLSLLRRLYKKGLILVNGSFRRKDLYVYPGDEISIYFEDEEDEIVPEDMDMDIVYEDEGLMIINKKSGIPVHTTRLHQNKTIANACKSYFLYKGLNRRIRFINRLDKDTMGLVMVAKNPIMAHLMSLLIRENQIDRKYLTLVEGRVKLDEGVIDLPILKIDGQMKRIIDGGGERALTKYRVLNRMEDRTLLEVQLVTGRGHQIRIHLSQLGHPIIGDTIYGSGFGDLRLKSYKLNFTHPIYKRVISIEDTDLNEFLA